MAPAGRRKLGVRGGALGVVAHELCRAMVLAATRTTAGGWPAGLGTGCNREIVAARLGVSLAVLNRMMSPGDDLAFRDSDFFVLIAADDLVPPEARHAAAGKLCVEAGGVFVPLAESSDGVEPLVNAAVMSLAAAAGKVAELAREARCDGTVCRAMTPERERAIESAAQAAERAAEEVIRAARAVSGK
jgi:hypothetical protein